MAGDWIKMRVGLDRDPRVIRMADYLATRREFMDWLTDPVRRTCDKSAYEHVTRNVTVALCVTALLVTWGAAREQGDRVDDDLVINHCDLETLSAISGLPCFGDALAFVGWADEADGGSVVLPKFFKDNESPDDKHKRQAAERQARFRAKQAAESNAISNVTDNVTVTHREEKRREEEKQRTPIVPKGDQLVEIVLTAYHSALPRCQRVSARTPKRCKRIKTADKLAQEICAQQGWSYEPEAFWAAYFGECANDPWMRGDVPNPKSASWKQNLDVLIAEDRFAGVMDRAISSLRQP